MSDAVIKYQATHGEVKLSPGIVRRYLVSGNGSVTDTEIIMFMQLCRYQGLNPFLREAYLIKWGDQPATIVTGKDTFTKRAATIAECAGWNAGVIVNKEEQIQYRKGSAVFEGEKLIGGWAEVHRKEWKEPLRTEVSMSEYMRKKADGTPMASWASIPATMIRKVALVQALREAFPANFQGLYSPEEMPVDTATLPAQPVKLRPEDEEGASKAFDSIPKAGPFDVGKLSEEDQKKL